MAPSTSTDHQLPPGWKEYVKVKNGKKTKYYSRAETGQKFYSKLAVMRYLNMPTDGVNTTRPQMETDCNQTPQTPINHEQKALDEQDTSRSPMWLPTGWITEEKSRPDRRAPYKIYIDPATGKKFYSQPQVTAYLKALAQKKVTVEENQNTIVGISAPETDVYEHQGSLTKKDCRSRKENISNRSNESSDVIQSCSVDGLPVGWTKEIKIRHSANRIKRDPYYKDPMSGYVFRSKKDVLRYLETGDISKCSIRPIREDEPNAVSHEDANSNELSGHHKMREHQRSISNLEVNKVNNYPTDAVTFDQLQNTAVDGLPIGWTREIQIRRDGRGKDSLYIDPISRYMFRSKKDALRYIETGDISKCACKPKLRDAHDIGSAMQACGKDQSSVSTEEQNQINNSYEEPVETHQLQNPAETGLPIGWTKDYFYTDPISGYMFRSKEDALRYIETGDIRQSAYKLKKIDVNDDTGSTKQQVSGIQNSVVDGLPIGWTREIQPRRNGIGKDSFYIDPVSGYMFRSKIDALRYIETGDISKCACKPKKRDANAAGSAEHVGNLLTPVSRRNLPRLSSRQHYISEDSNDGEKNWDASISKAVKSESSIRKRGSSLPSEIQSKSRRVSQHSEQEEKRILQSTRSRTSKRLAGCQPEMPNLQVSERDLRAAMKMSCEDEANILPMITINAFPNGLPQPLCPKPASVDANSSGKQELAKKIMKQKVSRNTPANTQNSNKGITPRIPSRTSSIRVGSGYRFPSNLQLSEGALGAKMRKSSEEENQVFPWININDVPDVVPQPFHCELATTTSVRMSAESEPYPLDTEPAPDVADIVSMVVESVQNIDMGQKSEEHSAQQINEKQDLKNFKPQDVQGGYQFGDPLMNPFMNFAFNNSKDATPDENNLAYQGYSQQQTNNFFVQGNNNSAWSISQNLGVHDGNPSNSNSVRQQAQVDQFRSQFSLVTPGFGVPSFGVPSFGVPSFGVPSFGSTESQRLDKSAFKRNI